MEPGGAAGHHLHSAGRIIIRHHPGIDGWGLKKQGPHKSRLTQNAVGFAFFIAADNSSRGIGGLFRKTKFLQRQAVDHAAVNRHVDQTNRVFFRGPVQIRARQFFLVIKQVRGVSPPHDPFPGRSLGRLSPQGCDHIIPLYASRCRAAVRLVREQSIETEVIMYINEAGNERLPLQVEDFGLRAGKPFHFLLFPHAINPPKLNPKGFSLWPGLCLGQDIAILKYQFHTPSLDRQKSTLNRRNRQT
ncbi:MAG: hypothetical protein H6Q43_3610 [Deltaproteobacteria bacterium]|nr:hypothetical protein [Deltaproteobacteria bacterium]